MLLWSNGLCNLKKQLVPLLQSVDNQHTFFVHKDIVEQSYNNQEEAVSFRMMPLQ